MTPDPGVTVALPVHRDAGTLATAFRCLAAQTLRELDIVLVLNGSDGATAETAQRLAREDRRARVITLPDANLAVALNTALEAARFPLVARMDADDTCPPERLAAQAAWMRSNPDVAALGTAWELADAEGLVISTVRPPCDSNRLRWRLLLGNVLAHGSMMLRREPVLRAGGYDARCERSQDYELWLRLAKHGAVACLPDVLYRHRARFPDDPSRTTPEQAAVASPFMLREWRTLPQGAGQTLDAALAAVSTRERGIEAIEHVLDEHGPTRDGLLAWLWATWARPSAPRRVYDAGRLARVREVGGALRNRGVPSVYLWGAGDHTRWLLDHAPQLGLPIAGIVDDRLGGQERFGRRVGSPSDIRRSEWALISSDWHEDAIWAASAPHRARGVNVVRLYGEAV